MSKIKFHHLPPVQLPWFQKTSNGYLSAREMTPEEASELFNCGMVVYETTETGTKHIPLNQVWIDPEKTNV